MKTFNKQTLGLALLIIGAVAACPLKGAWAVVDQAAPAEAETSPSAEGEKFVTGTRVDPDDPSKTLLTIAPVSPEGAPLRLIFVPGSMYGVETPPADKIVGQ